MSNRKLVSGADNREKELNPDGHIPSVSLDAGNSQSRGIDAMMKAASKLALGAYGNVARKEMVTGSAATTVCYEGGAAGPALGRLVEEFTAAHEDIHVISRPGPSRALAARNDDTGLPLTMKRREHNLQGHGGSNIAIGFQTGRDVVVHGNVTNRVYAGPSTITPAPPKKSFRNVLSPIKGFKGREPLITLMSKELGRKSVESHWSDRMLALVGLGGMGKTELARKFAEVHEEAYPNVAWLNAETEESLKKSFETLAQDLEIPCKSNDKGSEIAARVFGHVGQHVPSSLFIFDNANSLHSQNGNENAQKVTFGIFDYLPRNKYENPPLCLITTQTMDWDAQEIDTLEVQELTKEESIQFLQNKFKLSPADLRKVSRKGETLGSLMDRLYDYVQGYPLALQLAAANVNYMPKKDSASFLQNRLEIFLGKLKDLDTKSVFEKSVNAGGSDYKRTFRIIWDITMERIANDEFSSQGLHLFKILAYTDPDGTPCKDLEKVYTVSYCAESKADTEESFESALHLLQKLVVVQVYRGYMAELHTRMHRMVQSLASRHGIFIFYPYPYSY